MLHKIPGAMLGLLIGLGAGLFGASLLNDALNESRENLIASQRKVIAFQGNGIETMDRAIKAQTNEISALVNEITALNHKAAAYGSLVDEQRKGIAVRDRLLDERSAMIRTLKVRAGLTPSTEAIQPAPQGSR